MKCQIRTDVDELCREEVPCKAHKFTGLVMTPVILESPYAGDLHLNVAYLRACIRDCLRRGEAPFASHGLYTQPGVLDDNIPAEREQGIQAGFAWRQAASKTVCYTDLGISKGMHYGLEHALQLGHQIEMRKLDETQMAEVHNIALHSGLGVISKLRWP